MEPGPLVFLQGVIDEARASVEENDHLIDSQRRLLSDHFPSRDVWTRSVGATLAILGADVLDTQETGANEDQRAAFILHPNQDKETILKVLDAVRARLSELLEQLSPTNRIIIDATQASLYLPSEKVAGLIHRYETSASRQLYKAMDELERLQRLRLGDNVPPPISIRVVGE